MKFYRISIIFLFLLMISMGAACAEDASQAVQDNLATSDSEVMADAPDGTYGPRSRKAKKRSRAAHTAAKTRGERDFCRGAEGSRNQLA